MPKQESEALQASRVARCAMSEMERTINRKMVEFAVGRVMFCPRCNKCLDARRAVQFVYQGDGNKRNGIRCADCFDKLYVLAALYCQKLSEILDGRVL